jgi:hypothetical protein
MTTKKAQEAEIPEVKPKRKKPQYIVVGSPLFIGGKRFVQDAVITEEIPESQLQFFVDGGYIREA